MFGADFMDDKYILDTCFTQNDKDNTKYDPIYCLESESIHRMGILHSTHEITLYLDITEENKIVFKGAWEMNCGGDWSYKESELEEFEDTHKGLLADIQEKLSKGAVSFRYHVWDGTRNVEHITSDISIVRANHKQITITK